MTRRVQTKEAGGEETEETAETAERLARGRDETAAATEMIDATAQAATDRSGAEGLHEARALQTETAADCSGLLPSGRTGSAVHRRRLLVRA